MLAAAARCGCTERGRWMDGRYRVTRRRFVWTAGVASLGLLVGCGSLPYQRPPPTAVKVYR